MSPSSPLAASQNRLEHWAFPVIGLTGSVAMGKSTAAAMIRRMGVPVYDADATVHRLTRPGGLAVAAIQKRFPEAATAEGIDRQRLGAIVFADSSALADLESVLHPLVRADRSQFLKRHALQRSRCVVLDIPLLFETNQHVHCHAVIVVSAPPFLQRQRVMSRAGMTEEKFAGILKRQMSDTLKRRYATVVIPTGLGRRETWCRLKRFLSIGQGANSRVLNRSGLEPHA